jgi:hypothetical protein
MSLDLSHWSWRAEVFAALNLVSWLTVGFLKDIISTYRKLEMWLLCFSDTWPRIIWVDLPEEGSIDHDPTIDRKPNCISVIHKEGLAVTVTMVSTH